MLPDTTSSDRWETKDHPLLVQAIRAAIPGVQIDYDNAQNSSDTQFAQAQKDLANGDCILVVGAHDSVAAASIVSAAKALNVPVIAYDRLIQSKDTNYYVSFNNVQVGQLQAQYIVNHYRQYANPLTDTTNIALIDGSQTDTNGLLFSQGMHSVLDPYFASNSMKNVYETFTADWNNTTAGAEFSTALTDQNNNIQVAYVANDGMADSVINALKSANLVGKVLVTGQDATNAGIHHILAGEQNMTVYKPIAKEAQSVGDLVKALYNGTDVRTLTNGTTVTLFDGSQVPSILDAPIAVDSTNIASTVITDNFIAAKDVCAGIPSGKDGVC